MDAVIGLFIVVIIGFFYFVPTIVATNRNHHNRGAIFVLNVFLGWTFLGWVIALVWAASHVKLEANK